MQNIKKVLLLMLLINTNMVFSNDIYERNQKGVVYLDGDRGYGSGVIISNQGHILTNYHVIKNNDNLRILLHYEYDLGEYEEYFHKVEFIKQDPEKDLALLKIINPKTYLFPIKISAKKPSVGSRVHAIGHPDFQFWSYTSGFISQTREDYEWTTQDKGRVRKANVYLTQTPIGEGSSGGPLLNNYGNLIGLNTFGSTINNFQNFAVTVDEILEFIVD